MEKDIKLALQYKNPNEIFPDSLFTFLYWSISFDSAENSFDCNITKLVESINANFPKNVKANRISLTVQDNYSELNTYVNNLRTQSEEARDYKFFDILFDANCQSMVGLYISKKEYKRKKEKNTFFDE